VQSSRFLQRLLLLTLHQPEFRTVAGSLQYSVKTILLGIYGTAPTAALHILISAPQPKLVQIDYPERMKGLIDLSKCEWITHFRLFCILHRKVALSGFEPATYRSRNRHVIRSAPANICCMPMHGRQVRKYFLIRCIFTRFTGISVYGWRKRVNFKQLCLKLLRFALGLLFCFKYWLTRLKYYTWTR